jgi:hypothetical protein
MVPQSGQRSSFHAGCCIAADSPSVEEPELVSADVAGLLVLAIEASASTRWVEPLA